MSSNPENSIISYNKDLLRILSIDNLYDFKELCKQLTIIDSTSGEVFCDDLVIFFEHYSRLKYEEYKKQQNIKPESAATKRKKFKERIGYNPSEIKKFFTSGIISAWEYSFIESLSKHKSLSTKQEEILKRITKKFV